MAVAILLLPRQLGDGLRRAFGEEERVVAESMRTAGRLEDASWAYPLHDQRRPVVFDQGEDAAKSRASPFGGETLKLFEKPRVVRRVVGVGPREPCRRHARGAVQRVDLESGVVADRRDAERAPHGPRLPLGVLTIRPRALGGKGDGGTVGQGLDARDRAGEHRLELPSLPRVLRREDD